MECPTDIIQAQILSRKSKVDIMTFIVERASRYGCDGEQTPCDGAYLGSIIRVETRTLHTPEEFDDKFSKFEGKWISIGTNHRINKNGWITRDRGTVMVWFIEINTIDELIEFCNKNGDVVIEDCAWNTSYKKILIYDDYIE